MVTDLFAKDEYPQLRGKWILICRASGLHRIPSYQRLSSCGPWAPRDQIKPESALPHIHQWSNQVCPRPYEVFPDGTDNIDSYQEGYGARLVFLNPVRAQHVVDSGCASAWIRGDVDSPEEALIRVQSWISAQIAMKNTLGQSSEPCMDENGVEFVPDFPGKFDACVTYDDFAITTCAHIAEQLQLITTPCSVVNEIKNKYKLRQICEQIGIPVPRSLIFRLTDLFQGNLRYLLDPTDPAHSSQTTTPSPDHTTKTLPPTQRLNLFTDHWLPQQDSTELHTEVHVDIPLTPEQWTQYYEKKNSQLRSAPLQYPLVIKPFSGAGSNFVRKAYNYQELLQCLQLFFLQCRDANPHSVDIDALPNTLDLVQNDSQHSSAAASAAQSEQQLEILRGKWKYWGLPDLNISFMIEECILGQEFDLDILIQDSQIKYLAVNDNYPTAGHKAYFQEAGGLVHSTLPFKVLTGCRILPVLILKYFTQYFLESENIAKHGPCQRPQESLPKCVYSTPVAEKCPTCQQYGSINGVWHFEGMIARNMKWAQQYEYGLLAGSSLVHSDDDSDEDFYAVMPIEINQRTGGSEVSCLTASVSGICYQTDNLKLHINGVKIPNYFSLLPQYHEMNRIGFDRFPECPIYDPKQVRPRPPSFQPSPLPLTNPTLLAIEYKENPQLRAIPYPEIALPLLESGKDALNFDPNVRPMAVFDLTEKANPTQLHTNLPLPAQLQPLAERISYQHALTIAETFTTLLKLPQPTAFYPPQAHPRWKYVSSINWVPFLSGRVDVLELPKFVPLDKSYLGSMFWFNPGSDQTLIVPPHGFDFLGWLVAGGNTPMEAHFQLLRLAAELRYWIEPQL